MPSNVRNKPTNRATIVLALLPISPKKERLLQTMKDQITIIIQKYIYDILQPLNAAYEGFEVEYSDGFVRKCFPILAAWCADYIEYVELLGLRTNSYPRYEVAVTQLGNAVYNASMRDFRAYEELREQ